MSTSSKQLDTNGNIGQSEFLETQKQSALRDY